MDSASDVDRLVPAVLEMARDPQAARTKAATAREFVERRQGETMAVLAKELAV
jgi:outer membrane murein-binding lipoprotein Lpp